MKYRLNITKAALQDEMEAYHYYENISPGLGDRFLENLEKKFTVLSEHPDYYSYSDANKLMRDVAVDDFPYIVVYEISGIDVVVYSVHGTSKKPFSL